MYDSNRHGVRAGTVLSPHSLYSDPLAGFDGSIVAEKGLRLPRDLAKTWWSPEALRGRVLPGSGPVLPGNTPGAARSAQRPIPLFCKAGSVCTQRPPRAGGSCVLCPGCSEVGLDRTWMRTGQRLQGNEPLPRLSLHGWVPLCSGPSPHKLTAAPP